MYINFFNINKYNSNMSLQQFLENNISLFNFEDKLSNSFLLIHFFNLDRKLICNGLLEDDPILNGITNENTILPYQKSGIRMILFH